MSLLQQRVAAAAPKVESLLGRARAANLRGELVTLPLLGRAWIELASQVIVNEIESAVYQEMDRLKLPAIPLNALTYDSARTALTLARCVRDPDDHAQPFGPLDEWLKLDIDLIMACGVVYNDVRERLDPIGIHYLTDQDREGIRDAMEKKSPTLLRSYGVAILSLYMLTGDPPPPSSPTPASGTGP